MANNLDKFGVPISSEAASIALMPKLQYRFLVEFAFNDSTLLTGSKYLSQNVNTVGRPTLNHEKVTVHTYNSTIYMGGKHTWQPIDVTFRDDINNFVSSTLNAQMQRQLEHLQQSAPVAAAQYKFGMEISTLTGGNTGTAEIEKLDTWTLSGCYIESINYQENNYATSDALTITATIQYDQAIYTDMQRLVNPIPQVLSTG